MSEPEKPSDVEKIACSVCLKEIPRSEAEIEEAGDYVLFFCGLDCYGKWREENKKE